jgi:hypothetical protein
MALATGRLLVLGVLLLPVGACSGSSSARSCTKALNGLSVNIQEVASARRISPGRVTESFDACGDAARWARSADAEQIATTLGFKPDIENPTLTTGEVFDYLCSRFGTGPTDMCRRR